MNNWLKDIKAVITESDLALFAKMDEQYKGKKRPTEREILDEIQAYRREKRLAKAL